MPRRRQPDPAQLQLPPQHLWISQKGARNKEGECDSIAKALEHRIKLDAANLMAKWIK